MKRNEGEDFNSQWLKYKQLPYAEDFYETITGILTKKEVA
jgi:hypothetical protein